MMRIGINLLLLVLLVLAGGEAGLRAQTKAEEAQGPDFKEVYDLIRTHLAGMSEGQLNQAAVSALVSGLAPRVSLVTNVVAASAAGETPLVIKSSVFEGDILYVRVGRVGDGLAQAITAACSKPGTTNKLKGVTLDLRYAGGDDYAAAAAAADLFVKKAEPLLNWGSGMVRSKEKSDAIGLPVAVLVNRQTAGAAEALAAAMRETGAGLILGGKTAGQAMVAQDFPLKNGERLRIATAPIQLGDGSAMSEQGLKPDIAVEVSPEDERAYYVDAFKVTEKTNLLASAAASAAGPGNGTNSGARRPRFNEAELVRERREGVSEAELTALRAPEPEKPLVRDPALARALDLLRGLALVRQPRS
ncbi:MAG: S41 family peptidase [Limisphaerales bacterium]